MAPVVVTPSSWGGIGHIVISDFSRASRLGRLTFWGSMAFWNAMKCSSERLMNTGTDAHKRSVITIGPA